MQFRKPSLFKCAVVTATLVLATGAGLGYYWAVVEPVSALPAKPVAPSALREWKFAEIEFATPQKLSGIQSKPSSPSAPKPVDSTGRGHDNPTLPTVVVNKKHPLQPVDYTPPVATLSCDGSVAYLNPQAADSFNAMCTAATGAGLPFRVTSSFRSYQNQVDTYNHWVAVNGVAGADTVSARPGYIEHQTGFAMDVATAGCALECFANTPQYAWMQAHAAEYGFVQRYYAGSEAITGYSAEAWHYRYVGVATAEDMKRRGISTLEQYWSVSGGDYA